MFLILLTAFLDILGIGLFIPTLPTIITSFWVNSSWTGYTQAVYAIGMFVGWLFFWRLSDTYGRKRMLSFTSILNLLSYVIMLVSIWSLTMETGTNTMISEMTGISLAHLREIFSGFTPIFWLFLFSRFIGGLGWSGFWVIQAYISDISSPAEKTKRMGYIGATFWLAFLIGPAIGGILSSYASIQAVIILCIIVIAANVLSIWIVLEEPKKHHLIENIDLAHFHFSRTVVTLLFLSFGATLWFAAMQSMSSQFYADRFWFTASQIGYTMAMVGIVAITYQWWLVKFIRKVFDEVAMIRLAFSVLAVAFVGFAMNSSPVWLFFWIAFFPLGMGSFQPSVMSLIANKAGKEVGKVMGYNTSIQSIWQIAGPLVAGLLYTPGSGLPFFASAGIFALLFIVSLSLSD